MIRRAFHLTKNINGLEDNFNKVINVHDTLNEIECALDDVLNVYKIFHDKLNSDLTKEDVIKCDKIINFMSFDKQWGIYYHNSRKSLNQLLDSELVVG